MRLYLEYIHAIGRSSRIMARRHPARGFTVLELLLASLMMLIAVSLAGNGVISLLRNNYKANADSELRNSLNRTLEFMGDEVKRASIVADSPSKIVSQSIPKGASAILAFQIPDPNNPGQTIPEQVVYYVQHGQNQWYGPEVLWRHGPSFDENGNYKDPEKTGDWVTTPMTDMVVGTDPDARRDCDPFRQGTLTGWERFPEKDADVQGMYACVKRDGGGQVALVANAELGLTANDSDKSSYSISTKVATRASNSSYFLSSPSAAIPAYKLDDPSKKVTDNTLPILIQDSEVTLTPVDPCKNTCRITVKDSQNLSDRFNQFYTSSPITTTSAKSGDQIRVYASGMSNMYGNDAMQTVEVYTSQTLPLPPGTINKLEDNQILFILKERDPSKKPETWITEKVLLTIVPK